jgi:hypothetical protein
MRVVIELVDAAQIQRCGDRHYLNTLFCVHTDALQHQFLTGKSMGLGRLKQVSK